MWDRWQRGESLTAIGRAFDQPSSSIFGLLAPTGGIRPPPRQRSRLALTLAEREEISRGLACGLSLRAIAVQLGRASSPNPEEQGPIVLGGSSQKWIAGLKIIGKEQGSENQQPQIC